MRIGLREAMNNSMNAVKVRLRTLERFLVTRAWRASMLFANSGGKPFCAKPSLVSPFGMRLNVLSDSLLSQWIDGS